MSNTFRRFMALTMGLLMLILSVPVIELSKIAHAEEISTSEVSTVSTTDATTATNSTTGTGATNATTSPTTTSTTTGTTQTTGVTNAAPTTIRSGLANGTHGTVDVITGEAGSDETKTNGDEVVTNSEPESNPKDVGVSRSNAPEEPVTEATAKLELTGGKQIVPGNNFTLSASLTKPQETDIPGPLKLRLSVSNSSLIAKKADGSLDLVAPEIFGQKAELTIAEDGSATITYNFADGLTADILSQEFSGKSANDATGTLTFKLDLLDADDKALATQVTTAFTFEDSKKDPTVDLVITGVKSYPAASEAQGTLEIKRKNFVDEQGTTISPDNIAGPLTLEFKITDNTALAVDDTGAVMLQADDFKEDPQKPIKPTIKTEGTTTTITYELDNGLAKEANFKIPFTFTTKADAEGKTLPVQLFLHNKDTNQEIAKSIDAQVYEFTKPDAIDSTVKMELKQSGTHEAGIETTGSITLDRQAVDGTEPTAIAGPLKLLMARNRRQLQDRSSSF